MKTSALHTASDRRDRFGRLAPKIWLEKSLLRTWVIAEPKVIMELLRSPNAAILDIADMIGAIERTYGARFPHVEFAARHLPLFLEGEVHDERRRSFSRFLANGLARLEPGLPSLIERHLRPFRERDEVELISEVTGPLVRDINAVFVGHPLPAEIDCLHLLDLFALNKTVARLKDLDLRVAKAVDSLGGDGGQSELIGNRFTALAMGFETLMTLITEGVMTAFHDEGDRASLSDYPIETGVPISYRKALNDFEMAGHAFKAGDLFRLQLQTLGYSLRHEEKKAMFGTGGHSCVGKQASLRIWGELKRVFDGLALRGRILSCELLPSHYLVRHKSVRIEVSR